MIEYWTPEPRDAEPQDRFIPIMSMSPLVYRHMVGMPGPCCGLSPRNLPAVQVPVIAGLPTALHYRREKALR